LLPQVEIAYSIHTRKGETAEMGNQKLVLETLL